MIKQSEHTFATDMDIYDDIQEAIGRTIGKKKEIKSTPLRHQNETLATTRASQLKTPKNQYIIFPIFCRISILYLLVCNYWIIIFKLPSILLCE
ncbi:unnamed protein product [Caenorhabditis angaria]|uniref:Uncharacterized protein n=1 Tax=Caenorhabditis angaria TaxID=860376 RepID=A0A9P1N2M8_9PELO|nr:unnamed protein product [Caenorhabditis angaria]